MNTIRRSAERGFADHGWLKSFSYVFVRGLLRSQARGIWTAARHQRRSCAGRGGIRYTAHQDMEIVSYVLEGELAHKDSMGNGSTIGQGSTAHERRPAGVRHQRVHIPRRAKERTSARSGFIPRRATLRPSYEEKRFGPRRSAAGCASSSRPTAPTDRC